MTDGINPRFFSTVCGFLSCFLIIFAIANFWCVRDAARHGPTANTVYGTKWKRFYGTLPSVWNAFVGLPQCDSPTANTIYGTNENRFTFPMKQPFCGMADAGSADVGLRTHSMRPCNVWFMESGGRVSQAAAHHGPTVNDNRATCLRTGGIPFFVLMRRFPMACKPWGGGKNRYDAYDDAET